MRDNFEKDLSIVAAKLILDLWKKIGMSKEKYLECLANELSVDVETLKVWGKEGRGVPADRTPDDVFNAIEEIIQQYGDDKKFPRQQRATVCANWRGIRDSFKDDLTFAMRAPSVITDTVDKMLDRSPLVNQLKAPFEALQKDTRFKLYSCFDAWNGMSENDYLFICHYQKLNDTEKAKLLDYLKAQTIPAAKLLDCIQDDSTKYWLKMLSVSTTKKSSEDIWDFFSEKLLEQNGNLTMWQGILKFLKKCEPIDNTDIEIVLLFKHSMTESEKKDFVLKMNARIPPRK